MRTLPHWITRRVAFAFVGIGLLFVALAAFAYGTDIIGSWCNNGTASDSVGRGTCSYNDGVDTSRDLRSVDTIIGVEPASWIGITRWPALVLGALGLIVGLLGLGGGSRLGITPTAPARSTSTRSNPARSTSARSNPGPSTNCELVVAITTQPNSYTVHLTTPAGDHARETNPGQLPKNRGISQLEALVVAADKRRFGSRQTKAVEAFGTGLFEAIFSGSCQAAYRASMNMVRENNAVLRVVLQPDEACADLPWEYLHDPELSLFIARSRETSLVRRLGSSHATRSEGPIEQLRILSMSAAPKGTAPLDTAVERDRINQALGASVAAGRVQLDFVNGSTPAALDQALTSFQPHVFHFAGHGSWDDDLDDGVILFEDRSGFAEPQTGRDLGTLLNQRGLRLAIFNSCHAARPSKHDRFAGITSSLVAQGVPAAVGMQFQFDDKAAVTFASTLLRELGNGVAVDSALTSARIAVFSSGNKVEWGTPVLIARVPADDIIAWVQSAGSGGVT